MNLKQLEAFVCVAETKSFSKAGKKLYLTQPTVSAHIQSLETELNCKLLIRTTKDVLLSADGQKLYGLAKQMLQLEQTIYREFRDRKSETSRTILAGASTVPGQYILPQLLSLFSRTYPQYRIKLMESDSMDVVRNVREGKLEVGFAGTKVEDETCVFEAFYVDRLMVVTPNRPEYDRFEETGFPLEQLYNERLIIREDGSGTWKETREYLEKAGIDLKRIPIVAAMSNQETIKKSVSTGMGISIISGAAAEDYVRQGKIRCFSIREGNISRKLYMVWNKANKPGPAARVFVQFVREMYEYL